MELQKILITAEQTKLVTSVLKASKKAKNAEPLLCVYVENGILYATDSKIAVSIKLKEQAATSGAFKILSTEKAAVSILTLEPKPELQYPDIKRYFEIPKSCKYINVSTVNICKEQALSKLVIKAYKLFETSYSIEYFKHIMDAYPEKTLTLKTAGQDKPLFVEIGLDVKAVIMPFRLDK